MNVLRSSNKSKQIGTFARWVSYLVLYLASGSGSVGALLDRAQSACGGNGLCELEGGEHDVREVWNGGGVNEWGGE